MKDFGYDISNFTSVWPTFGSLEDVRRLISTAAALGIRVLMDLVPNHSSDQHPWFLSSRSSLTSPKRDWYVWRPAGADGGPPNNWRSMFCADAACSAWKLDKQTNQYYYHQFLEQQPDLNWRNPDLVQAMHDVMRFWLRLGVAGFRVDAFAYLLEDPQLRDEPVDPDWKGDPVSAGYEKLVHTRTENQPGMHDILQGMRAVLAEFGPDRMMIGEIYADKVVTEKDVISFYGSQSHPEFSMPFNMELVPFFGASFTSSSGSQNFRDAAALRQLVDSYDKRVPAWGQPNYVLGNHDNHRVRSRTGDSEALSRSLMVLLLTLRGTPTLYNGDEIGMRDGFVPAGKRQDPPCIINYTGGRCRDPERTPLQWTSDTPNGGFTGPNTVPWLPVSQDLVNINVAQQKLDSGSMLAMTKQMLHVREQSPSLHAGTYQSFECDPKVFCFFRRGADGTFVVVINLGKTAATIDATGANASITSGMVYVDSQAKSFNVAATLPQVQLKQLNLKSEQSLVIKVTQGGKQNPVLTPGAVAAIAVVTVLLVGAAVGIGIMLLLRLRKRNVGETYREMDPSSTGSAGSGNPDREP